jgi:hypothetical protein
MTENIPDIASAFFAGAHLFARERAEAFNQLVLLGPSVMLARRCALWLGGERLQHLVSVGSAAAAVCGQDSVRYQTSYVAMAFSTLIMSVLLLAMSAPGGIAITRSLA